MKLYFNIGNETRELGEPGGILGRAEDAVIHLTDLSVSGRHAEFSWDGKQWWIHPLTDRSKVLRDGMRLPADAKVPLGRKGKLQFGNVRFSFWVEGEAPVPAPMPMLETAPQPDWQRLRIKESPVNLPPRKPPLVDIAPNQLRSEEEGPPTVLTRPKEVAPAPPRPPVQVEPAEPPPRRSGRGEFFLQAGLLSGLLALLCTLGFCAGIWLLE